MYDRIAGAILARYLLAMSLSDAKKVLGFPPNSNPTSAEVAKAYRALAIKHHPDRGGDTRKMVELNVAKEVLDTGKGRKDFKPSVDPYSERMEQEERKRNTAFAKLNRLTTETSDAAHQAYYRLGAVAPASQESQWNSLHIMAYLLSEIEDQADNANDEDNPDIEDALKKVAALAKAMSKQSAKLSSDFRHFESSSLRQPIGEENNTFTVEGLEKDYKTAAQFGKDYAKLLEDSKKLLGLLRRGYGPDSDFALPVSEATIDEYHRKGHEVLRYIVKNYDLSEDSLNAYRAKMERAVKDAAEILEEFDLKLESTPWNKATCGIFRRAQVEIRKKTKTAAHRVAERYRRP